MRDKKDATYFIRTIDTTHPSNIRCIIPPPIYRFLQDPEKVKFQIEGSKVIITKFNN